VKMACATQSVKLGVTFLSRIENFFAT
jgi:hypothetical protein